jgi:hypothetical protein
MITPIDDQRLSELYRYWLDRRGTKRLPSPADFDFAKLPYRTWTSIGLVDVIRSPERTQFQYGRIGLPPIGRFDRDISGEYLDNALLDRDGYRDYVFGIYRESTETRQPIYSANIGVLAGQAPILTKRVCLPLSSDQRDVDMALVARAFVYEPIWLNRFNRFADGYAETERVVLDS